MIISSHAHVHLYLPIPQRTSVRGTAMVGQPSPIILRVNLVARKARASLNGSPPADKVSIAVPSRSVCDVKVGQVHMVSLQDEVTIVE